MHIAIRKLSESKAHLGTNVEGRAKCCHPLNEYRGKEALLEMTDWCLGGTAECRSAFCAFKFSVCRQTRVARC